MYPDSVHGHVLVTPVHERTATSRSWLRPRVRWWPVLGEWSAIIEILHRNNVLADLYRRMGPVVLAHHVIFNGFSLTSRFKSSD